MIVKIKTFSHSCLIDQSCFGRKLMKKYQGKNYLDFINSFIEKTEYSIDPESLDEINVNIQFDK